MASSTHNGQDDHYLEVQLEKCEQHLKATRTCLKTLHGDLCYFQAALHEFEADLQRLSRDNDLVLASLSNITRGAGKLVSCQPEPTPDPPTTPTTPRAPWHIAVEDRRPTLSTDDVQARNAGEDIVKQ